MLRILICDKLTSMLCQYTELGESRQWLWRRCFFLSGAAWLNEGRCPGGRPFCQRKLSEESQIQWKSVSLKATKLTKQKTQKTPTTMQSPRVQGRVGVACYSDGWIKG